MSFNPKSGAVREETVNEPIELPKEDKPIDTASIEDKGQAVNPKKSTSLRNKLNTSMTRAEVSRYTPYVEEARKLPPYTHVTEETVIYVPNYGQVSVKLPVSCQGLGYFYGRDGYYFLHVSSRKVLLFVRNDYFVESICAAFRTVPWKNDASWFATLGGKRLRQEMNDYVKELDK